ncbi:MAG: hypothetical protein AAGI17_00290 [Planctomycetota bacterium]
MKDHAQFTASTRPTRRCLEALAPFGVTVERGSVIPPTHDEALAALRQLEPGEVATIGGHSGAGKSRLLRALAETLGDDAVVVAAPSPKRLIADQFEGLAASELMPALTAAGLGEARVLAVTPGQLSDGERARLSLAIALHRAEQTNAGWLLADEFGSVLDRETAACVAAAVRLRLSRSTNGLRLVVASAHEDLPSLIAPDLNLRLRERSCEIARPRKTRPLALRRRPTIERGTIADFDGLAHHHYRAGRPATWSRVLRAVTRPGDVAGVLVASYPTLNGSWRDRAWPDRYSADDKHAAAMRVNRELRCISRFVVTPRWRGLGVASGLVRVYLAEPETQATEAVSVMGAASPFFDAAGMTRYRLAPGDADRRLLDAIEEAGVEAWRLVERKQAERIMESSWLAHEVARWKRESGARTRWLETSAQVMRAAAARVAALVCGGGSVAHAYA